MTTNLYMKIKDIIIDKKKNLSTGCWNGGHIWCYHDVCSKSYFDEGRKSTKLHLHYAF